MKLNKFKEILKKNFVLLWRSKKTMLAIFLGPLILTLLLGIAFDNKGMNRLSVASYSEQYNNMSNSLLERLEANNFDIARKESEKRCIDDVKQGRDHMCIIIPCDFEIAKNNELVIYIDRSRINLAENIVNLFSNSLKGESSELSLDMTKVLINRLDQVSRISKESKTEVAKLLQSNSDSDKTVKKMESSIDELDSALEKCILNIEELKSNSDKGVGSKEDIEDILELADDSRDLVEDIKKVINSSDLERLDDQLGDMENKIRSNDIFSKDYWNRIDRIVGDLNLSMRLIRKKADSLSKDLTLIEGYIAEETDALKGLDSNLEAVEANVSSIRIRDADRIVNPITADVRPIVPEDSHLENIFPSLIVMIIMLGGVLLSSTANIVEKNDKASFRNIISPTRKIYFLAGRYFTDMTSVAFQLAIFLGISLVFFDINAFTRLNIFLILLIAVSFFTMLGALVGNILNSEEGSVLISIIITSIMLFFSSTILPIENMSDKIYRISKFNPFVLSETALRKSIVYGMEISSIQGEILFLLMWTLIVISAIFIINIPAIGKTTGRIRKKIENIEKKINKIIFVEE